MMEYVDAMYADKEGTLKLIEEAIKNIEQDAETQPPLPPDRCLLEDAEFRRKASSLKLF